MSNRFSGPNGRVFLGQDEVDDAPDQFSIHMYARKGGEPSIIESGNYKIKDLVEAVNELPGVTATYEPPKPKFVLPKGIGAVVKSPFFTYVRSNQNEWRNVDGASTSSWSDRQMIVSDPNYYTILSEGVEI